jgi:hypothetical protein
MNKFENFDDFMFKFVQVCGVLHKLLLIFWIFLIITRSDITYLWNPNPCSITSEASLVTDQSPDLLSQKPATVTNVNMNNQ